MRFTEAFLLSQVFLTSLALATPLEKSQPYIKNAQGPSKSGLISPSRPGPDPVKNGPGRENGVKPAKVTPTVVPSVGAFTYGGCLAEPFFNGVTGVRGLGAKSTSTPGGMTVESCASFCSGYTYFGVEYADECYCSNTLTKGTTLDHSNSNCDKVCGGNAGEYCGGSGHFNVYQRSHGLVPVLPDCYTPPPPPCTTPTKTPATTSAPLTISPTPVQTASGYNFIACAVEAYANGAHARSLDAKATCNSTGMTAEYCSSFCSAYTFFGVEFSGECYCDNEVSTGTTLASAGDCNDACAGNPREQCGGWARLNLYERIGSPRIVLPTTYVAPTSTSSTSVTSTTPTSTSSTRTSTSSTTSSPPPSATGQFDVTKCNVVTANFGNSKGTYNYTLYANTVGKIENTNNPGNAWGWLLPPFTLQFGGGYTACQAAQSCINEIGGLSTVYHSFDLHYQTDCQKWACTMYSGQNDNAGYFNVQQSTVSHAYGFSGESCDN